MAQLLTRPPHHPTATILGTSTDSSYHQSGDENGTRSRDHARQQTEAQAYGHTRANLRIRAAGPALSKSTSASPDDPDGPDEYDQPLRPRLAPREPDAAPVELKSPPSFPRSSSGPPPLPSSGSVSCERAPATHSSMLHINTDITNTNITNTTNTTHPTSPTTSTTTAPPTSMATAAAGSPAPRLPLSSQPSSSVPALESLPPIQPLQDPDDDDQLHDFPFHQFSAYNPSRGWLSYGGTYSHSASTEASFAAASAQTAGMSNQPSQPPGRPRLPGATNLGPPGSPSFPLLSNQGQNHNHSQNQSQSQNHYGYSSHANGSTPGRAAASHLGVSVGDLYRQSPAGEPVQQSSHLPSMRTIDVQPPPPHGMPLPGPPMMQAAAPPSYMSMLPPPYSMPSHGLQMHGLPGHLREYNGFRMPPLSMSPIPRHKKEIKRRTKTGCMTCRKRRIKCDETHPTCNNCKKSKRECAGYDPVFRQQPQSPGALQTTTQASGPASSSGTATYTAGTPITPTAAAAVATAAAATASTESTLAAVKSTSAAVAHSPVPSSSASTPTSGPSIYAVTATSASSGGSSLNAVTTTAPAAYHTTSYASRSILSPIQDWSYTSDSSGLVYRAKMKVDEMIGLAGPAPPAPTTQPTLEMLDDITKMYFEIYVPGLTSFFETTWYNFKSSGTVNPVSNLLNNKMLVGLLSAFLSSIARVETADPSDANMVSVSALETRIVWALAAMAYVTPATVNLASEEPLATDNAIEVRNRLSVMDALLSGGCVRTNPCMPPPRGGSPARIREHQFWWWLAEYLRLQEDAGLINTPGNSLPRLREQALGKMRNLLDGHENRDIIYSIAILRHLAPRYSAASDMIVPPGHEDEANPRIKFAMATEFIRKQAQDHGAGLTNVGRRIAEIGLKAFVQPGYSIRRS